MTSKIACIVGPTAVGKTAVAIETAKIIDARIISADSVQVYRGLDIGSAKPTRYERAQVPHYLIDCIDVDSIGYSVAEYKKLADAAIADVISCGKFPLIVGGTGLYINALTYPLNFTDVQPDFALRTELMKQEKDSPGILYEKLKVIDPKTHERLHKNDLKRIVRALEVFIKGGKPLSDYDNDFINERNAHCDYDALLIGITMPRELLYERINRRVDDMITLGLLDEVRELLTYGYDVSLPAFSALGYKQLIAYLTAKDNAPSSLEETIELIKRETRRFAKRQLTWFKRDKRIIWMDITEYNSVSDMASHIAELIRKD